MGSPGPPASLPPAPQPRYYALHATHYTLHTTHYSLHTKEPQSRLSRRNRERIDPEQVQSSPAVHSLLSVTRETDCQRRESGLIERGVERGCGEERKRGGTGNQGELGGRLEGLQKHQRQR